MGDAISWLAVKDVASEAVLKELALSPTAEMEEYGESLFTGCTLPNGWFLLVINKCGHAFVNPNSLASLSRFKDVIACSIEEHVMWCTAELWRDGAEVWRIEHDAQLGISHINTSGRLPEHYYAIEKEFVEQQRQAGEDSGTDYIFDIPLQTAKHIVGFKHDETGLMDGSFMVFRRDESLPDTGGIENQGSKPWWKPW